MRFPFGQVLHKFLDRILIGSPAKLPIVPSSKPPGTLDLPPVPSLPAYPYPSPGSLLDSSVNPLTDLSPINGMRWVLGETNLIFLDSLQAIDFENNGAELVNGLGHYVHPSGTWGQVAASGVKTVKQAANLWRNSSLHYREIVNPRYIFGAVVVNPDTGFATATFSSGTNIKGNS